MCESRIRQVWFADDAAAGGTLAGLREWWNRIQDTGAAFGYYLNAAKTNLFVKPEFLAAAQELFLGTGVNVTVEGVCHLGAALGSLRCMLQRGLAVGRTVFRIKWYC